MKTIKATGKRTAETRSTWREKEGTSESWFSSGDGITNWALSRTGFAALVIGAGCGKTTCGAGLTWVADWGFALDIDVYWTFEPALPVGCLSPVLLLVLCTKVSIVSALSGASSFL